MTTVVYWRWWLLPVGSTALFAANGWGRWYCGWCQLKLSCWRWRWWHWLRRCLCWDEPPVGTGGDRFVGGCGWWFCAAGVVAEAGDPLMSLTVSIWWLSLVCVGGCKSAWIGGLMCRSFRWWVCRYDGLRHRCWKSDYCRWWWIVLMNSVAFFFCN